MICLNPGSFASDPSGTIVAMSLDLTDMGLTACPSGWPAYLDANEVEALVLRAIQGNSSSSGGGSSTPVAFDPTAIQQTIAQIQSDQQTILSYQAKTFDPVLGGSIFAFFFGSILILWQIAKGAGMVLEAVRRS